MQTNGSRAAALDNPSLLNTAFFLDTLEPLARRPSHREAPFMPLAERPEVANRILFESERRRRTAVKAGASLSARL